MIDFRTGGTVHWPRIDGVVEEIYDVAVLPGFSHQLPVSSVRPDPLPIDPHLPALTDKLWRHGALVLRAEAGAGKTTRVPPALLEKTDQRVLVCGPRRVAARLAARRVAAERGWRLGGQVGFAVRGQRAVGPSTRLIYMTDGVLLRRLCRDPHLNGVAVVVLDEVHERRLQSDLALALVHRLRRTERTDLKVVAMSATIGSQAFAAYLQAEAVEIPGRAFPVDVVYNPFPNRDRLEQQVARGLSDLLAEHPGDGDTLCFLPGVGEIKRAADACAGLARAHGLELVELHASLPPAAQDRALAAGPGPKLILATNVAETSVTPPGVTQVIDSGLHRQAGFCAWSGLASLEVRPISRSSAIQRAGRAGRVKPGRCLRLYTRQDFHGRPEAEQREMLRADLADVLLMARAASSGDPGSLVWLDPPPAVAATAAAELLAELGALTADGHLSALGRDMLRFPLHPRLARVLLAGHRFGIGPDAALAVALLAEPPRGRRFATGDRARHDDPSDVLIRVDQATARRSGRPGAAGSGALRSRLQKALSTLPRPPQAVRRLSAEERESALRKALLTGFPDRVAKRRGRGDRFLVAGGSGARLAPSSAVRSAEWVVLLEAEKRGQRREALCVCASAVEPDWLLDLFPDRIEEQLSVTWNREQERVEAKSQLLYRSLPLLEERIGGKDPNCTQEVRAAIAAELLAQALRAGADAFCPPQALERLRRRIAFAAQLAREIQELDDRAVAAALAKLCAHRQSFAELRAASLTKEIQNQLGGAARAKLEHLAPAALRLPGGRRLRVNYEKGRPPWIASRLQDFFGMARGPRLGGGAALVMHLLAPNGRAVQVTTDLSGFWERHYPKIAKALRRRYPRHAWPEDPLHTVPPRG